MKNYNKKQMDALEKGEINCSDFKAFINDYVDNELPQTLFGRLDEHVCECMDCQSEVSQLNFLKEVAKSFRLPPLSSDAKKRIHSKLNSELGLNL